MLNFLQATVHRAEYLLLVLTPYLPKLKARKEKNLLSKTEEHEEKQIEEVSLCIVDIL